MGRQADFSKKMEQFPGKRVIAFERELSSFMRNPGRRSMETPFGERLLMSNHDAAGHSVSQQTSAVWILQCALYRCGYLRGYRDNPPQLKLGASQFDRTPIGDRP
jgi:hypothetical protein